jgi:hypothetical protein
MSGYSGACTVDGQCPEYTTAPRYQIFTRDGPIIDSLDQFQYELQYNDYKSDPFSNNDPGNAISSRFDLEETKPAAFGGIDSKVVSAKLMENMQCLAISGPTQQQPAFSWSAFPNVYHVGLPEVWDFEWQTMTKSDDAK